MIESINLAGTSQGGGGTDEKAKVSANDTTAGFLNGKLVAGTNITLTENNNGGDETLTISAAGVTGFTGSQNTASPNNTVNASRLVVDAGTTNADAVIQPKGTGAFQLQLADGTATGGNKRGTNAIDLQTSRTSATRVASGANSFAAGTSNTASGTGSVAIGNAMTSSNTSSVAIGDSGTASGAYSVAIGYQLNSTGFVSVALGDRTSATADSATAIGFQSSASQLGMFAHASGRYTNNGDAQYERYVLRRATTSATPLELSADGNAPAANTRIAIANDCTFVFHGFVVARYTSADNESAAYEIKGVIDNNSTTVAFVGTPTVTVLAEDIAGWDVSLTADNTNKSLAITVTGENAKTIRWVATVHLTKVSG